MDERDIREIRKAVIHKLGGRVVGDRVKETLRRKGATHTIIAVNAHYPWIFETVETCQLHVTELSRRQHAILNVFTIACRDSYFAHQHIKNETEQYQKALDEVLEAMRV